MAFLDHLGGPAVSRPEEAEESYFVSMTDIMVGLLFIFIIMLMAFALYLKQEQERAADMQEDTRQTVETVRDEVRRMHDLESQRTEMLREIQDRLAERGVAVIVREGSGVLQLPEELLFAYNARELDAEGMAAIRHVASALDDVLPCYSQVPEEIQGDSMCTEEEASGLRLQAVFVEGHTDSVGSQDYNWDLSADRAISTFQALADEASVAVRLRNDDGEYLFSVAGYGENRPAVEERTEEDRRQNRRIDLRFVMNRSYEDALRRVESQLDSVLREN